MIDHAKRQQSKFDDARHTGALTMVRAAFGEETVLRLAAEFGTEGRVYIPQTPGARSAICRVLTVEQAKRLAAVFAGETLDLPLLRVPRLVVRIEALLRAGKRPSQIAREVDCSRRTVHKVKRRMIDGGQL